MPVDTLHPQYIANAPKWKKCRDAFDGEEAIKAAGQDYLPILSGQDSSEYQGYLTRAEFYGVTGRIVMGIAGAALRKEAKTAIPAKELARVGRDGDPAISLCRKLLEEITLQARVGALVDAGADGQPYAAIYRAEDIKNWKLAIVGGREVPVMVMLAEEGPKPGSRDPYGHDTEPRWRELYIDENGLYTVRVWRKKDRTSKRGEEPDEFEIVGGPIQPRNRANKPLTYIPFVCAGASGLGWAVEKSPVLDLVNVNLAHYRVGADLHHGMHWTALPTAWAAGFGNPKEATLKVGSAVAWVAESAEARAGYLEFSGAGLASLREERKSMERRMAVLGSRLLEERFAEAESGEAIKLRHHGERSNLASLAFAASETMTEIMRMILEWRNVSGVDPTFKLNPDFDAPPINPQLLTAMLEAVISEQISWETFYYNLDRGGAYREGWTPQDELNAIATGGPPIPRETGSGDGAE